MPRKPPDAMLRQMLQALLSTKRGSCCDAAAAVHRILATLTGDVGTVGAELITWIKDEGTARMDAGNHTAARATWHDGTYVVDTTCGQFGGPDFFVGSVSAWRRHILQWAGMAHRPSHPTYHSQDAAFTGDEMRRIAQSLKREATPRAKKRILVLPPAAPKPPHNGTPAAQKNSETPTTAVPQSGTPEVMTLLPYDPHRTERS